MRIRLSVSPLHAKHTIQRFQLVLLLWVIKLLASARKKQFLVSLGILPNSREQVSVSRKNLKLSSPSQ